MTRALAISDTGLRLIKAFEGFRPDARTLVTGVRVVGYGHRLDLDAGPVHMSRAEAEEQLLSDLEPIEAIVNDEVHAPLSQGQFDALCSLAFNIGAEAFRASALVRAMNNGRVLDAANGFDVWRKATVNGQAYVVDALMRRRTAEKSLFLRNEPAVPAPSAMLSPQADDGLRTVVTGDASGVIDGANIINAARVDPVTTGPASADRAQFVAVSDAPVAPEMDEIIESAALQQGPLSAAMVTPSNLIESLLETDAERFEADHDDVFDPEDEADFIDGDIDDEDFDDSDFEDDNFDDDDESFEHDDDDNDAPATTEGAPLATRLDLDEDAELDPIDLDNDVDPSDFAALISPVVTARETADKNETDDYPGRDYHAAETTPAASAIVTAAATLEDRLSALLDGNETALDDDALSAMPTSLFQPTENNSQTSRAAQQILDDGTPRSNLVSFPKRELVLDDAIDPAPMTLNALPEKTDGLIVIDDLAADDAARATVEPEIHVFDPEGDPAVNAARYLERQPSGAKPPKIGLGLWIPIGLGATLVGASAVFIGRGASQLLAAWGPTAVTAAAITGGLTLLFALYAMARIRFA